MPELDEGGSLGAEEKLQALKVEEPCATTMIDYFLCQLTSMSFIVSTHGSDHRLRPCARAGS
jgi:hypothetical protein